MSTISVTAAPSPVSSRIPLRTIAPTASLVLLILACVVITTGINLLTPDLQSAAILMRLNGSSLPWILRQVDGETTTVRELTFPASSGPVRARIFAPVHRPDAPGIVIIHGLHYSGINDRRLVEYARDMSAAGLRVLTPEIPGLDNYELKPQSVTAIGDAARWFAQQTHGPVTVMGLSFGGGLSLLAAAQPQYADSIKAVFALGAYDDMSHVANSYATGSALSPDGRTIPFHADPYGLMVIEYQFLKDFVPAADLAPIRAFVTAELYEHKVETRLRWRELTPHQREEALALADRSLSAASILQVAREQYPVIESISPHGHLQHLKAQVYLLNGVNDPIVSSEESHWLIRDLPPGTLHEALNSPTIDHVGFGHVSHSLYEKWRVIHLLGQVIHETQTPVAGSVQ